MGAFVTTALGFPTVLFTFPLVVVIGYWLFTLFGAVDVDLNADADADGAGTGPDGFLAVLGLGGVPVTVALSLLIAVAWFASLAGSTLLRGAVADASTAVSVAVPAGILVAALGSAVAVTRLAIRPLRRVFAPERSASRRDFVGARCVIRTGRVDAGFGQAEVTSADGSSAIVQVRQTGADTFTAGCTAVIYDYDPDGEFFWVVPLDPNTPTTPKETA